MNCREARELIQLHADNELDARTTMEVQGHLEACSSCAHMLETFLTQDQALKKAARSVPINAERLRHRILTAIQNEPLVPKTGWPLLFSQKRIAAGVVLAVSVGLVALLAGLLLGPERSVYAAAAADHADHCSVDKITGAVTNAPELLKLVQRYGRMNALPDLTSFGYDSPRGRICKVDGLEFLHLVYYDADRNALSIFVRPHDSSPITEELKIIRANGYAVGSASKSGIDLLAVSSRDEAQTSAILRAVLAQLQVVASKRLAQPTPYLCDTADAGEARGNSSGLSERFQSVAHLYLREPIACGLLDGC